MSDPRARLVPTKGKKVNATKYQGFAPRQTAAQRADRAMRIAMAGKAYAAYRLERETFYRDLIRKARAQKAL